MLFENEDKAAVRMFRFQLQPLSRFLRTKIGSETYFQNVLFYSNHAFSIFDKLFYIFSIVLVSLKLKSICSSWECKISDTYITNKQIQQFLSQFFQLSFIQ